MGRRGKLSARYWRLRFASDVGERLAELEDESFARGHDYDDEYDRDFEPEPRQLALDQAITALRLRIHGAAPFHTLPLGVRPSGWAPPQTGGPIEERLVDHLERVTTAARMDGLDDAGLIELEAVADRRFHGELEPLIGLALFQPFWLRSPSSWRPLGAARLGSLVEHLLLAYPTPRFLHAVAADVGRLAELRWMAWLIALGQGGSLRRLTELAHQRWPEWAVIPHKLVGCLARVSERLSPAEGLMAAELLRLGGSEVERRRLASDWSFALDPSANHLSPGELEFWRATVGWLIRRRDELDDLQVRPILAWARHLHTERERVGERFDWRGRTTASALREATAHRHRWYSPRSPWRAWAHHGWDWQVRIGEADWEIRELTNSTELQAESQAMSHCVRSYDQACWHGHTAIFSLQQDGRRRVTIELQLPSKRVVQVKRACNQSPSALELAVIDRWHSSVVAVSELPRPAVA